MPSTYRRENDLRRRERELTAKYTELQDELATAPHASPARRAIEGQMAAVGADLGEARRRLLAECGVRV